MGTRNGAKLSKDILLACAVVAGCAGGGLDVDADRGGVHGQFEEVELAVSDTGTVLAAWSGEHGWREPFGEPLDALPPSVLSDQSVEHLRAGGAPLSIQVRLQGQADLDIAPRGNVGVAGGNPCGEFSARYFPLDDATPVIAWPNVPRPDRPEGPALFAERSSGELVQIFHCNRLEIYPEQAGTVHLQIILWHVNHADQASDAIAIEISEAL